MIDRKTLDEALARHSTFAKAPPPAPSPDRRPVITEDIVKENLRRVRTSPALVTEHPDGTRSYAHDLGVQRDVLISTVSADRGEGSRESLSLLREEGDSLKVDGLLAPKNDGPARDASGRFGKRGE
jgi:hypothetical protein